MRSFGATVSRFGRRTEAQHPYFVLKTKALVPTGRVRILTHFGAEARIERNRGRATKRISVQENSPSS
jgi:hypothetical protein